jgi:hypothetical protein
MRDFGGGRGCGGRFVRPISRPCYEYQKMGLDQLSNKLSTHTVC